MTRYLKQAAESSDASGRRILVAEDEPLLALELARILTGVGYQVVGPAITAREVKRLLGEAQIEGALLDANLIPEVVDEVALMLIQQNVPFVVLTAYAGEMVPAACRGARVLAKPFNEKDLLATVGRLLDRPAMPQTA
jgi:DNA-binding response OmpR family regulator